MLQIAVALGGITAGVWQAYLLRDRVARAAWWVPASAVGWTLAALASTSADVFLREHPIRGIAGAVSYLGLVAVGGLLLGVATGFPLIQLLRTPRQAGPAAE